MTTELLPLVDRPRVPWITHIDDAGRCLDRARIHLTAAIEDLRSAAYLVPPAEALAEEVERARAEVVRVWDGLNQLELPLQ